MENLKEESITLLRDLKPLIRALSDREGGRLAFGLVIEVANTIINPVFYKHDAATQAKDHEAADTRLDSEAQLVSPSPQNRPLSANSKPHNRNLDSNGSPAVKAPIEQITPKRTRAEPKADSKSNSLSKTPKSDQKVSSQKAKTRQTRQQQKTELAEQTARALKRIRKYSSPGHKQ